MADEHPELVVAYMKAMIKVGRWANENKHAAGAILNRQTFYLDAEDTYQGIKDVDMVPSLSARNLQTHQDRQGLHGQPRLHQERLRRGRSGLARSSSSRRRPRSSRRSGSAAAGASCRTAAGSRWKASGSAERRRTERAGGTRRHVTLLRHEAARTSRDPGRLGHRANRDVHARLPDRDVPRILVRRPVDGT